MLNYKFVASGINKIYRRSVFTISDAMARLGGQHASLVSGGGVFAALFTYKLF